MSQKNVQKCNICYNNDCQNNSTCTYDQYQINEYKCLCKEGYYGEKCENLIDACINLPCKNNGDCSPLEGTKYKFDLFSIP